MRDMIISCSAPDNTLLFFFFNDTATTEIYTLSLHDALPIARRRKCMLDRALPSSNTLTLATPSFTIGSRGLHCVDITDQDFIHNIKILINPLDHASRDMQLGEAH